MIVKSELQTLTRKAQRQMEYGHEQEVWDETVTWLGKCTQEMTKYAQHGMTKCTVKGHVSFPEVVVPRVMANLKEVLKDGNVDTEGIATFNFDWSE